MSIQIVCDSSANILRGQDKFYATVPMKIIAGSREFVDTPDLNLQEMVDFLKEHKGKSGSSCPNVQDWLTAFGGNEV